MCAASRSEDIGRFRGLVDGAMRLRNSVAAELVMIAFVYAGRRAGDLARPHRALRGELVCAYNAAGSLLTPAGLWYAYVALPMFHSRRGGCSASPCGSASCGRFAPHLDITPMHGDRMGGLGFLSGTIFAFVPLGMAHGALLAGTIADRIFYMNQK